MKIFLLSFFAVASLQAASFTPETAAVYALQHNPDLAAARTLIAEAEGRLIQAGLWSNPEFEANADVGVSDRTISAGLSQKFPLAGRLGQARAVARVDVAMAVAEFHNQQRLLAGNVLTQARAILLLDKRIAVHGSQIALLDRILEQTTALASAGTGDTNDIGVVQLEKTTLGLQRQAQIVARDSSHDALRGLMGLQPGTPMEITGALPALPKSFAVAPERPDLQLALLQSDKSQAEQRLARLEKWEDLTVGLGVSRQREDGMSENMAQLKFSLPLPVWNRNQGRIAETQAAGERAQTQITARQLAISTEIREAQTRATGLAEILRQLDGTAQAQARQNTERIQQSVASGTGTFVSIYESRRQHLTLALTSLETEMQLVSALTDWETRTGHFPAGVRAALKP
ncbi:MAG: TolC family protein [Chthoniobacterales bacterium]